MTLHIKDPVGVRAIPVYSYTIKHIPPMPCQHCGRDLLTIPEEYRDFVHKRPDGDWCLDFPLPPEAEKILSQLANSLATKASQLIDKMSQTVLIHTR